MFFRSLCFEIHGESNMAAIFFPLPAHFILTPVLIEINTRNRLRYTRNRKKFGVPLHEIFRQMDSFGGNGDTENLPESGRFSGIQTGSKSKIFYFTKKTKMD